METFALNRFVEMKESIGWHKDKWLDIENIYISANDRGLKFGDGIFETVLIRNNNAVLIDEHIQRLEDSSKVLNINFNINKSHLKDIINLGITKLSLKNNQLGSIRINKKLVGLNIEGRAIGRKGCEVFKYGENIGTITSGSWSPTKQKAIAFAYIQNSYATLNNVVEILIRGKTFKGTITKRAFYKKDN